jgi:hypothetical protein
MLLRKLLPMVLLGTVLAAPSLAAAGDPPEQAFVHKPFPSIPMLPVPEAGFTVNLVIACQNLDGIEDLDGPPLPKPKRSLGERIDDYYRTVDDIRATPKEENTPEAASRRQSQQATTDRRLAELHPEMQSLASVCRKLGESRKLEPADLQLLRTLRNGDDFAELAEIIRRVAHDERYSQRGQRALAGAAPGLGAGVVDHAIRGLADFIVKRAKEEAIVAVQERIAKDVCGEGQITKQFLDNTCDVLTSLDKNLSLRAMGTSLHAAAVADLRRLPDVTLAYLIYTDPNKRAVYTAGRLAHAAFLEVRNGRQPFEVFAAFHAMDPVADCEGAKSECKVVLTSLRKLSALAYVATGARFRALVGDGTQTNVGVLLVGWILESETQLRRKAETMERFEYQLDEIERMREVGSELWAAALHFNAAQMLVQQIGDQGPAESASVKEQIAQLIVLVAAGVERCGSALITAEVVANADDFEAALEMFSSVAGVSSALLIEDWGAAATGMLDLLAKAPEPNHELADAIASILPLVVEVANAESSADVAAAIEAAAAPVGSYKTKYEHWTLSLNAFLGGGGGGEFVQSEGLRGMSAMATGFAPVGLHIARPWGAGKDGRKWMHFGALISVVDLGALTTYRFNTELRDTNETLAGTTEQAPEIGVAQIFSPGAFVVLGIGQLPLVLGGGLSMSPRLRRISETGVEERDATALRIMGFLAIDVTLYQFR